MLFLELIFLGLQGLIVLRIWKVEKQQERFRAPRDNSPDRPPTALGRAMRNIVESGMIYTVASILMFAAFTAQSTLNYPASALVSATLLRYILYSQVFHRRSTVLESLSI
jgi:hypothetical protein